SKLNPFQMFILSLIQIQFLYFLNIIITVFLPGFLYGIALLGFFENGIVIIVFSVLHYLFEIFEFSLFSAILFKLNKVVRAKIKKIFKKNKSKQYFIKNLLDVVKTYVIFVLPIIIIAAFLETYIADIIFELVR